MRPRPDAGHEEARRPATFALFTSDARAALTRVQRIAQGHQCNAIDPTHVFVALIEDRTSGAAKVLRDLAIELAIVRDRLDVVIDHPDLATLGDVGLTQGTKRVIEYAVDEARRHKHPFVSAGHLLLGLLRCGQGDAALILAESGVTLEKTRTAVERRLAPVLRAMALPPSGRVTVGGASMPRPDADAVDDIALAGLLANLDPEARDLLAAAADEARRLGHFHIGTEHVLLGLLRRSASAAVQVLRAMEVDPVKLQSAVEFIT